MRPTWAHLGPIGPRWAPCWHHEPCYQGSTKGNSHGYRHGSPGIFWPHQHQGYLLKIPDNCRVLSCLIIYKTTTRYMRMYYRCAPILLFWQYFSELAMECYRCLNIISRLCYRGGLDVTSNHDDVIKWKHFPRYWTFVRGIHRSPVNSSHKGQWREALIFTLICVWINGCVNNREAGDLRRYCAHYGVTVMLVSARYTLVVLKSTHIIFMPTLN